MTKVYNTPPDDTPWRPAEEKTHRFESVEDLADMLEEHNEAMHHLRETAHADKVERFNAMTAADVRDLAEQRGVSERAMWNHLLPSLPPEPPSRKPEPEKRSSRRVDLSQRSSEGFSEAVSEFMEEHPGVSRQDAIRQLSQPEGKDEDHE